MYKNDSIPRAINMKRKFTKSNKFIPILTITELHHFKY